MTERLRAGAPRTVGPREVARDAPVPGGRADGGPSPGPGTPGATPTPRAGAGTLADLVPDPRPRRTPSPLDTAPARNRFLAAAGLTVAGAAADVLGAPRLAAWGLLLAAVLIARGVPLEGPHRLYAALAALWIVAVTALRRADLLAGAPAMLEAATALAGLAAMPLLRPRIRHRAPELPAALAGAPLPVCRTDGTGRVLACNDAFGRLVGLPAGPLAGARLDRLVSLAPEDLEAWRAKRGDRPLRARAGDGRETELLLLPEPDAEDQGPPGVLCLFVSEADARCGELVTGSGDPVALLDAGGTLLRPNTALAAAAGVGVAELLGTPLARRLEPGDAGRLTAALRRARARPGHPEPLPGLALCRPDGARRWLDARLVAGDSSGRADAVLLTARVLPAPPDPEPAQDDERLRALLEAAPDAVLVTRASDGTVLDLNRRFIQLLGVEKARCLGRREAELGFWTDPGARAALTAAAGEGRGAFEAELGMRTAAGETLRVGVRLQALEHGGEPCLLTACRDVTEQRRLGAALRESEEKFERLFRNAPDGLALVALDTLEVLDVNRSLATMLGRPAAQLVGSDLDALAEGTGADRVVSAITGLHRAENPRGDGVLRVDLHALEGRRLRSTLAGSVVRVGGRPAMLLVVRDDRDRIRAEAALGRSEARFRGAFENAPIGMMIVDREGAVLQVNKLLCEMLHYTREELTGMGLGELLAEDEPADTAAVVEVLAREAQLDVRQERCLRRRDGSVVWTTRHPVLIHDEHGAPDYWIVQLADITEMKKSQERMERLAFYDTLTELANRRLFADRLEQSVKHAVRTGMPTALLYLDLDNFKRVNDTLGHEAGDQLLREVARRLTDCVRTEDTVARPGGDEFTILLNQVRDARAAGQVARNVLDALKEPVSVSGHQIRITTSIGITLAPDDARDPDTLTKNADLAMYRAKERGRDNYQFFAEEMNTRAMQRLVLENQLRTALIEDQFLLYYQPKVRLQDRQIAGMEALLRWWHPDRGLIVPDTFMTVAEETGFVVELGAWALRTVCAHVRALDQAGCPPVSVAVNISARQFRDPRLIEIVTRSLREHGIDPRRLELEITETLLMHDIEEAVRIIEALKALGVRISVDDFGTGYSSLYYLKRLPIDIVKVDRTFVADIPTSNDDMAITAAVIAMAHALNLQVVAEGVETPEQLFFLNAHHCEYGQGFLFAPPKPFREMRYLLERERREREAPSGPGPRSPGDP